MESILTNNAYAIAGADKARTAWSAAATRLAATDPRKTHPFPRGREPLSLSIDALCRARMVDALADCELASVWLLALLAPQFDIDLDHVERLVHRFRTAGGDEDALVALCFPQVRLADPINVGDCVLFASASKNLGVFGPSVHRIADDAFEIRHRVVLRANPTEVGVLPGGELIVLNGVHRLAACLLAGLDHAPCIIRRLNGIGDMGLSQGSLSILDQLMNAGASPARLFDLLAGSGAVGLWVRSTSLVLEVDTSTRLFSVPTCLVPASGGSD